MFKIPNLESNVKKHLFGKLMKNTPYEEYALNNKIQNKNKDFIERKTGSAKFQFAFIYKDKTFGVWTDYVER